MVLLFWRRCWSPGRGRERSDWEGQDAGRWRTGQVRLLRPRIGFGDKQTVEGRAGQWWQTWAVSGPAAPTPSSPPRWGPPLVCSRSEWQSLVSWAPWWWWRPWSSAVPGWAGGKNWRSWWRQRPASLHNVSRRRTTDTSSGPAAVWLFCFPKSHRTSHSSATMKGGVAGRRRSCDGSRVQSNSQTERKNYSAGRPSWGRRLGQQYSSLVVVS